MRFLLLEMRVNGIKNIDKEIELQFHNKTLGKLKESFNESHVKSIYGTNGAGKTGLMCAINIYKNLLTNTDFLTLENSNGNLKNLINQNTKKFTIEVVFACLSNTKEKGLTTATYSHYIEISEVDNSYQIVEEHLCLIKGTNLNNREKYETIFHVKNGKIEKLVKKLTDSCKKDIYEATMNLLNNSSAVNILVNKFLKMDAKTIKDPDFYINLCRVAMFSYNIIVILQNSDLNYIDIKNISEQVMAIFSYRNEINDEYLFEQMLSSNKFLEHNFRTVEKAEFEKFEKEINNLCNFIKVFKENLESIEIKKDENGDNYECELILKYNDGKRINEKYESNGIKKIISLFGALNTLDKGGIVFIDEFDSNIHDVLLLKLIGYVANYTNGQLIFTTHNLGPMEILKDEKYAIDFLSTDSKISSWVKNGNSSPVNVYRNGLIKYSPFNLEPISFLGVFGNDDDI